MVLPRSPRQTHVAVGNVNIDITLVLDRLPGPEDNVFASESWVVLGGAATNYSIAVARAGHRSLLVSRVGGDAARLGVLETLGNEGVDTSFVEVAGSEGTGMVVVLMVKPLSTRSMITYRGANEGVLEVKIPTVKGHYHLASVPPRLVARLRRELGEEASISYDPGGEAFRRPREVVDNSRYADWIFINTMEIRSITGSREPESAVDMVRGRTEFVVVKHGAGGASVVTRDHILSIDSPPKVDVVDVTGAGDAFDAWFNMALLSGMNLGEALKIGVAAGAAKVGKRGSSSMPLPSEVESVYRMVSEPRRRPL